MHLAFVFCICVAAIYRYYWGILNTLYVYFMPQRNYSNNSIRGIDPHNICYSLPPKLSVISIERYDFAFTFVQRI